MNAQVTVSVLQRVLRIKVGTEQGTAFTFDLEGRQYVITAAHVAKSIAEEGQLEINQEDLWKVVKVKRINVSAEVDLAVFAPEQQVTATHELGNGNLTLGQEAFFLGYPYNLTIPAGQLNSNRPLPFVKRATVSGFFKDNEGRQRVFLDGINNPGFSGGPVVIFDARERYPQGNPKEKVVGVISGFLSEHIRVNEGATVTRYTVPTNTGIVEAVNINHALDAIRANPIGFKLSK